MLRNALWALVRVGTLVQRWCGILGNFGEIVDAKWFDDGVTNRDNSAELEFICTSGVNLSKPS